jgi:peptidylprolyl isomerase
MTQAKHGDTVLLRYTGRLTDGTPFDSSSDGEPMEIRLGAGELVRGLESEIEGMEEGTAATVTVRAADAYGERSAAHVHCVPLSRIPQGMELDLGQRVQAKTSDGQRLSLIVTEIGAESVTLDANHPLAGKDFVFDVELLEIVKAA